MPRKRPTPETLRPRRGLNPTRVRMTSALPTAVSIVVEGDIAPVSFPKFNTVAGFVTALEFLQARFPEDAMRISELVSSGQVYDDDGEAISSHTPFTENKFLYLFREPPADEPKVVALEQITELYRDENLLVVDKPHQVSVIPRGRWVTQTALIYLRNKYDLPELSPLHRLDRPTAGVLAFTVRPEVRGAYQTLFQKRLVSKKYLAVTPWPPRENFATSASSTNEALAATQRRHLVATSPADFPLVVASRIKKFRGLAPAQEIPGEPNAITEVNLFGVAGDKALFELKPLTGKTHQLRLHLNSLGLPIVGDPFWPEMRPDLLADPDPQPPLQLLAQTLTFTDPFTGKTHQFTSKRTLSQWSQDFPMG